MLFARWTEDFDCGYETSWWYVIKDSPFDINALKAKRRYEINKGKRNFEVKRILPRNFIDDLLSVTVSAYSEWPEKYRPVVEKGKFSREIQAWDELVIYGGFDRDTGELCAYSCLKEHPSYLEFNVLRVKPEHEKKGINAAMVAAIVESYNDRLCSDFYINDGARAIRHETAFQDYLEKYFGFRKAYCKLKIKYRFPVGSVIRFLYLIRSWIDEDSRIGSLIYSVLQMEEIQRTM